MKNNYSLVQEIIKRIKDESMRHNIIFLDTFLGSYHARSKYPENFIRQRQITGCICESEYIAKRREGTLWVLETKSPEEALKYLTREMSELNKNSIAKDRLYNLLVHFEDKQSKERAGERLEIRLLKQGKIIGNGTSDREKKKTFLDESSIMSMALRYELGERDM